MPTDIPNLATVMKQAGYSTVEWHGKWHVGGTPAEYGFEGWQPPDAGNYLSVNSTLGGGDPDNDGRFLTNLCNSLDASKNQSEPFCIVASFVNPHDVYVAQHGAALGYKKEDFSKIKVPLPTNLMEDPDRNNKPRSQGQMSLRYVPFDSSHQEYINFYAYLHTVVDAQIGTLLDKVEECGFTDSTLILRTADHGEQGLSHSLVEKFYNCYQESIHIPFIVSNPVAFPERISTDALSSHLDIVPTLASLLSKDCAPSSRILDRESFQGKDLTRVFDDPKSITGDAIVGVQPSIHFTYDDIPCPGAPSIIRCLHKRNYKYAVYFTHTGKDADWELYNLQADPLENTNLAGNPQYTSLQEQLDKELHQTMIEMETLPTNFEWPPSATPYSKGFDHPVRLEKDGKDEDAELASLLSLIQKQQEQQQHGVASYAFCDQGTCITLFITVENIGMKCSDEDICLTWDESSLTLCIKNYETDNQTRNLSFVKLFDEITNASFTRMKDELVLTLEKKNPDVEWKSVNHPGNKIMK